VVQALHSMGEVTWGNILPKLSVRILAILAIFWIAFPAAAQQRYDWNSPEPSRVINSPAQPHERIGHDGDFYYVEVPAPPKPGTPNFMWVAIATILMLFWRWRAFINIQRQSELEQMSQSRVRLAQRRVNSPDRRTQDGAARDPEQEERRNSSEDRRSTGASDRRQVG